MTGTACVATMPSGSDKSVSAGFLPRIREAQAPATAISAAAVKTIVRPWWNGAEISCGKKVLPASASAA